MVKGGGIPNSTYVFLRPEPPQHLPHLMLVFQTTGPPQPPPPTHPCRGLPRGGTEAFVARLLKLWGSLVTSDLTPNQRSTGGQRGGHREVGQKKEMENLVGRKDGDGGRGVKQSLQK